MLLSGRGMATTRRAFRAQTFEQERHAMLQKARIGKAAKDRRDQLEQKTSESPELQQAEKELTKQQQDLSDAIFRGASDQILADREVMLAVVLVAGQCFFRCSDELRGDLEVALAATGNCPGIWAYASDDLRADRLATLAAAKLSGVILEYASPAHQDDKEIVLAAVSSYSWSLGFASDRLKGDLEVVNIALTNQDPRGRGVTSVLRRASAQLRSDKAVVLAAISLKAWALFDASLELKGDRDVVLAALRSQTRRHVLHCGCPLSGRNVFAYASHDFRKDEDLVLEAARVDGAVIGLASLPLRQNKDFVLRACRCSPEEDRRLCYEQADGSVRQSVTFEDFVGAANSVLGVAGESGPTLTVTLVTEPLPGGSSSRPDCSSSTPTATATPTKTKPATTAATNATSPTACPSPSTSRSSHPIWTKFWAQ
mmetsp:Transcript_52224/g.111185  ORF Transcript_52224/g.111185 Transcript_52224/m.111185 type:complete len:427 (-) Transcript_52224:51-1331(-)